MADGVIVLVLDGVGASVHVNDDHGCKNRSCGYRTGRNPYVETIRCQGRFAKPFP